MISGISSAYSAYTTQLNPVYETTPASPIKKQEDSDAQKTGPGYPGEINDEAIISDEAKALLANEQASAQTESTDEAETSGQIASTNAEDSEETSDAKKTEDKTTGNKTELNTEEQKQITELKTRDIEVKAHEQAHIAAAAGINASAPSYSYETGPDGKRYAVGGEVNISFTESSDPASNISKAEAMKTAALAPADPSAQDRSVARHADQIIAEQRKELSEQQRENANMIKDSENTKLNPETTPENKISPKETTTPDSESKTSTTNKMITNTSA